VDNFDYYVVAPHFSLEALAQKRMLKLLKRIPNRKLILVDKSVPELIGNYGAVYQDFSSDIAYALSEGIDKLRLFSKLNVMVMPNSLYSEQILPAVEKFCRSNNLDVEFHYHVSEENIRKNEVYLMLNSQHDSGLLSFSRIATGLGLKIGEDISVISYNDSPLNEIILNGLTAVSTDFQQMGAIAAQMIQDKTLSKVKCNFRMFRRSTF
jgi:hypothetical protein